MDAATLDLVLRSAVVGAVVAAIVTAVFTFINTSRQLKSQREQTDKTIEHQAVQTRLTLTQQAELARLADQRALRDAKRERLRSAYVSVLVGAQAFYNLMLDPSMLFPNDTPDQVAANANIVKQRAAAQMDVSRTFWELLIETDATEFVKAYWAVLTAYRDYSECLKVRQRGQGNVTDKDLQGFRDVAKAEREKMEAIARQHLAELDRPLP